MNESEFRSVGGIGGAFRDPSGDLKRASPAITTRAIAALVFLLVSSAAGTSDSAKAPAISRPATLEVWPAGTRLLIPERVMDSYRKVSDSWSRPSVYLFANYFLTGPSLEDERKETVYVPLVNERGGEAEQREVLMDIMNIRSVPGEDGAYVTDGDIHIIALDSNGKKSFIGVDPPP